MNKIYFYIIGAVVILAPIIYFGISYSMMKADNKKLTIQIARLEDEKTMLLKNIEAKDVALKKCEENAKNLADTAKKIDENHKKNDEVKDKIDKVIESKPVKKEEKKVEVPNEYKECKDTKKYSTLLNEIYYPNNK